VGLGTAAVGSSLMGGLNNFIQARKQINNQPTVSK
jgi:hypothetical protein